MKSISKILLSSLFLVSLAFVWTGCVGEVGVRGGGYYGGGPWYHEDIWLDGGGRGWYGHGGGAYVYPGRGHRRR